MSDCMKILGNGIYFVGVTSRKKHCGAVNNILTLLMWLKSGH